MARFELCIYGKNYEILKKFETDKARYGAFEEAVKFTEQAEGKKENEVAVMAFQMLKNFVKNLFPSITDEEIKLADLNDINNLAFQVSGKISAPMAEMAAKDGEKN